MDFSTSNAYTLNTFRLLRIVTDFYQFLKVVNHNKLYFTIIKLRVIR